MMQYRKFGQLDWQVSALGFGCMRLPILEGNSAKIDEAEAARMLAHAIDQGVNYVDTAYPYHGGQSEIFVGKFLKNGYRQKVRLATKLPCWLVESSADFDKYINDQLNKLQTDHIDFYLLHALGKERWTKMNTLGVLPWAEKAITDGRIGCLGFSFHDDFEAFQQIIDATDLWKFCQIQYNYMDVDEQAGMKGLQYAAAKGLAVVIMEPIRGGHLANPPQPVQMLWDRAPIRRSAVDWALQWLWNQPEVTLTLSGMSTMQQVEENLRSAELASVGSLSQAELDLVNQVRDQYKSLSQIPCTQCEYCLPCPSGVNIPRNFAVYNEYAMYGQLEHARVAYNQWIPADQRADQCLDCKNCEDLCPQHIPISEWLPRIHELLATSK